MMYFEACNFQVNRLDNLQGGDVALFGGVVVGMSSYTDPEDAVIALNKVISVILNQKKEGKNEWREVMKEFDIETQKVK